MKCYEFGFRYSSRYGYWNKTYNIHETNEGRKWFPFTILETPFRRYKNEKSRRS